MTEAAWWGVGLGILIALLLEIGIAWAEQNDNRRY